MKKIVKLIISVALTLSVAVMFTVSASATSDGKIIYKNDFSGNSVDETMWYVKGGSVGIVEEFGEKFLRCTSIVGDARTVSVNFGPAEAENVDISLKLRIRSTATHAESKCGIFFRSVVIPAVSSFGYEFQISETMMALYHRNAHYDTPTRIIMDDYNAKVKAGLWNNLKVSLRENRIVVYLNGEKIIDMVDETTPSIGGFGISGTRYTFDVDDLSMTKYSGSSLPEPTPNESPLWAGELGTDESEEKIDTGTEVFNIFGTGGEKVSSAINAVDPNKLTVNSYIAIGLIVALVLLSASTFFVALLLVKEKNKDNNPVSTVEVDKSENNIERQVDNQ